MFGRRIGKEDHRWFRRFLSVTLAVCVAATTAVGTLVTYPEKTYAGQYDPKDYVIGADSYIKNPQNQAKTVDDLAKGRYMLEVDTGTKSGEFVNYFRIDYVAEEINWSNVKLPEREESVFINTKTGVSSVKVEQTEYDRRMKTGRDLLSFGLKEKKQGLATNSTTLYDVQFPSRVKKILNIAVIMTSEKVSSPSWSCEGMRLVKYEGKASKKMYGYYSNLTYTRFENEVVVAQMTKAHKFNASEKNYVFNIARKENNEDGDTYYANKAGQADDYALETGTTTLGRDKLDDELIFRVDLADRYGAGIEEIANSPIQMKTLKDLVIPECLFLTVIYTDTRNRRISVDLPVLTSTLANAYDQNTVKPDTTLADYAGQGDTLAFSGHFPDLRSIESVRITYGDQGTEIKTGKGAGGFTGSDMGYNSSQQKILNEMSKNKAGIAVAGVSIYQSKCRLSYNLEGNSLLVPVIEGLPFKYYRPKSEEGLLVKFGGSELLELENLTADGIEEPVQDYKDEYLVSLSTDSVGLASSTEPFSMSISYKDKSGAQYETAPVNLVDATKEFYGYWPGYDSSNGNRLTDLMGYYYGMSSGKVLSVRVKIEGVDTFTGMTLYNGGKKDDWQMSGVTIRRIESIGRRYAHVSDIKNANFKGNRYYTREVNGVDVTAAAGDSDENIVVRLRQKALVQSTDAVVLDLENANGEETEIEHSYGPMIHDDTTELTYDQTKINYGFAKARCTYQVSVKIPKDSNNADGYGDSGSVNQYFFQLVFENGRSAYVLANQQFSGDGFRSDSTSRFTISTNEDFGELKSVNIISDNTASNSDVYDKLNIEKITITNTKSSMVNVSWVISDLGWIDVDYTESVEGNEEAKARSEERLVHNYPVTGTETRTKLQICINNSEQYGSLIDGDEYGNSQFDGSFEGTIWYQDSLGQRQSETFSAADLYTYAGYSTNNSQAVVDTNYMTRKKTTDRFEIDLTDVVSVQSVQITARRGATPSYWNINSISVGVVEGKGVVSLNARNEYESSAKVIPLTSTSKIGGIQFNLCKNESDSERLNFEKNSIHGEEIQSSVLPSNEDTLNVYARLSDGSIADTNMNVAVIYDDAYSNIKEAVCAMKAGKVGYYTYDMAAANITKLSAVRLMPEGRTEAQVSEVIVERIRNHTLIETYTVDFGDEVIDAGIYSESVEVSLNGKYRQKVTLEFGNGTEDTEITKMGSDVGVILWYTTTFDDEYMLESEHILLSASNIDQIHAGKLVELTYHLPDIGSIEGIRIYKKGDFAATIGKAVIGDYDIRTEVDEDGTAKVTEEKLRNWYSFYLNEQTPHEITNEVTTISDGVKGFGTENSISDTTILIKTAEPMQNQESGISQPVEAAFSYLDYSNSVRTLTVSNLNAYVEKGDFTAGSTARIRMLIPNLNRLLYIRLTPYRTDAEISKYSWWIDSISCSYDNGESTIKKSRAVNRAITPESSGTILFVDLDFVVTAEDQILTKSGIANEALSGTNPQIVVGPTELEKEITLSEEIEGLEDPSVLGKVRYRIDKVSQGGMIEYGTAEDVTGSVTCRTDANHTGGSVIYRVTYWLEIDPNVSFSVDIVVNDQTAEIDRLKQEEEDRRREEEEARAEENAEREDAGEPEDVSNEESEDAQTDELEEEQETAEPERYESRAVQN